MTKSTLFGISCVLFLLITPICSMNTNGVITLPVNSIFTEKPEISKVDMPIIQVNAERHLGEISPFLFGVNHRYHNNGTGSWDVEQHQPNQKAVEGAVGSGIPILRFPGGTVSTTYHWTDGIGVVEDRPLSISGFTGEPIHSTYGLEEHMMLVEMINATTTVVVNFISGTAQEAAAWVAYANGDVNDTRSIGEDIKGKDWGTIGEWAAQREENQIRLGMEPHTYNIQYWEVGNELYGNWEFSWTHNATRYALGGTESQKDEHVGKYRDWRDNAAKSNGEPNQVFYIKYSPVIPVSQSIKVENDFWTEISNLSMARSEDKVYEFNSKTGKITFGDNIHGKIPPAGNVITATYESGTHDGFIDFYTMMKFANPDIKVGSCFNDLEFIKAMGEEHPYDFLILHDYFGLQEKTNIETAHLTAMTASFTLNDRLDEIREDINTNAGSRASDVEITVTEYNLRNFLRYEPSPHFGQSLSQAMYVADVLRIFINNRIPLGLLHCYLDLGSGDRPILSPPPHYTRRAASYTLELFSRYLHSQQIVAFVEKSPTYNIALRNINYVVPYLETIASIDHDKERLSILLINKHPTDDLTAQIQVNGFTPSFSAAVYTLNGPELSSYNSDSLIEKPKEKHLYIANREILPTLKNNIIIGDITIKVEPDNSYQVSIEKSIIDNVEETFSYTFPAHSVTIIEFTEGNMLNTNEEETEKVEFYIDNVLQYADGELPYTWTWKKPAFGVCEIMTISYSENGEATTDKMNVFKLL